MSEVQDAVQVSAALDDGLGRLNGEHKDQERVHAALSNRRHLTWAKPSSELTARVMLRASLVRPARKPKRWPLGLAAGLLLAGGLSWVVYLQAQQPGTQQPGSGPTPGPIAEGPKVKAQPPAIDLGMLTRLPERSEPKIAASLERPMLREVQAIRDDTQRGFEAVMSKLPISMSMDFGGSASTPSLGTGSKVQLPAP